MKYVYCIKTDTYYPIENDYIKFCKKCVKIFTDDSFIRPSIEDFNKNWIIFENEKPVDFRVDLINAKKEYAKKTIEELFTNINENIRSNKKIPYYICSGLSYFLIWFNTGEIIKILVPSILKNTFGSRIINDVCEEYIKIFAKNNNLDIPAYYYSANRGALSIYAFFTLNNVREYFDIELQEENSLYLHNRKISLYMRNKNNKSEKEFIIATNANEAKQSFIKYNDILPYVKKYNINFKEEENLVAVCFKENIYKLTVTNLGSTEQSGTELTEKIISFIASKNNFKFSILGNPIFYSTKDFLLDSIYYKEGKFSTNKRGVIASLIKEINERLAESFLIEIRSFLTRDEFNTFLLKSELE